MSRKPRTIAVLVAGGFLAIMTAASLYTALVYFGIIYVKQGPRGGPAQSFYMGQFAATPTHFVFAHQHKNERIIVAFEPARNVVIRYGAVSGYISSPSQSFVENAFYLVHTRKKVTPVEFSAGTQVDNELYKCRPDLVRCEAIFRHSGAIESVVDFPDGEIVFISAPAEVVQYDGPKFVSYRQRDFYLRRRSGDIERLTTWRTPGLYWASAGRDRLIFQYDPRPKRYRSEIYSVPITPERQIAGPEPGADTPFIQHGKNFDTRPILSADGTKTAFKSSSEGAEFGWRHDIVIVETDSKKVINVIVPEAGTQLSPPAFAGNEAVRFMSFESGRYKFWQFDLSASAPTLLGSLNPDDVGRAKAYDLLSGN